MISEILKFKPKLDTQSLNSMTMLLSRRFGSVAKKFGKGLKDGMKKGLSGVFKGGAIAGVLALVTKLLNPIQEVETSINDTLTKADNIVTKAKQYNSSAGKYFKLQQVAQSTGMPPEVLDDMLSKFQVKLAEARSGQANAVSNFVNEKDTAEAFFKFSQALQRASKDQQVLAQKEIFGEDAVKRASEFFQTDYSKRLKEIGAREADYYEKALTRTAGLEDLQSVLTAKRNLQDMINKSKGINEGVVRQMDESAKIALQKENERLNSYKDIKATSNSMNEIQAQLEKGFLQLSKALPIITKGIEDIAKSRFVRGLFN
jgi:hypothetical protein